MEGGSHLAIYKRDQRVELGSTKKQLQLSGQRDFNWPLPDF